jgi:outer membrane protein OmpA-like peptidoglycan-associated protein
MRRVIGLFLFSVVLSTTVFAQEKLTIKEKFTVEEANNAFMNRYFDEALKLYKKVYNKHMTNPSLTSQIGFCYLELDQIEDALSYFSDVNAGSLKKKEAVFYFGYGSALQKIGNFAEALEKYNQFKQLGKKSDINYYEVDRYVSQVNYALSVVDKPVSASVTNIGDSINSGYDDYHPSVTADGKTFIFTSRRSDSKGGELLADGQYYEDIYEATWNEEFQAWGESKPVEGALNSKEYDANCSITPDGSNILVYRNLSKENKKFISPTGGGDIYTSKKGSTGRWGAPKIVEGVNSTSLDVGACITADGKTMFFVSDRTGMLEGKGAQGGKDIWYSTMQEDGIWGKAKNIGELINTIYDEISVYVHPNGKTLFFASDGHDEQNIGGYDIFRTTLDASGKWTKPVNLGFPINTHRDEKEFVLSTNGKVGWISSKREKGKLNMDIYQVDLAHFNVLTGESEQLSIVKGKVQDESTGLPLKASVVFKDTVSGKEFEVKSQEDGTYFNTLVSHKTYKISVKHKGYKAFSTVVTVSAPKANKSKKRRRTNNRKGKKVKARKTASIHTVEKDLKLERLIPINVVSKDLFKTQMIAFKKNEIGYEINSFSKGIIDMFATQQLQAKELVLGVEGHFSEGVEANSRSKDLADQVVAYLVTKGVDKTKLKITYMGASQPIASNESESGRTANQRVEIKIIL